MRRRSETPAGAALAVALGICIAVGATSARAGGLWAWEVGTAADVGNASAAWGTADDVSSAWTNPAAMTLLERSEVGMQLTPAVYLYRFDRDDGTTVSGGSGANTSVTPLLGSSGVWAVNDRLRVGVSLGGLAGGSLDYGNEWSGRYVVTEVDLTALGLLPSVAYRVNDWLSLGAGPVFSFGTLEQDARVKNLLPGQSDGRLQIEDGDFAVGGVIGALVEPLDGTRVAITYRTPVKYDLNDHSIFHDIQRPLSDLLDLTGVSDSELRVDLEIPQQVLIAVSQRITDDLTLVANADWQQWSEFGAIELRLASQTASSVSADVSSRDTWHVGLGLRWRPRPRWLLTTGVAYDSSMFSESNRSPVLPMDRQIRVGGGVQYDLTDDLFVGFSYEYMNAGDAPLRAGSGLTGEISGDYDRNEIHFFTVSLNWRP